MCISALMTQTDANKHSEKQFSVNLKEQFKVIPSQ